MSEIVPLLARGRDRLETTCNHVLLYTFYDLLLARGRDRLEKRLYIALHGS